MFPAAAAAAPQILEKIIMHAHLFCMILEDVYGFIVLPFPSHYIRKLDILLRLRLRKISILLRPSDSVKFRNCILYPL